VPCDIEAVATLVVLGGVLGERVAGEGERRTHHEEVLAIHGE
jgi:hypothetical protein